MRENESDGAGGWRQPPGRRHPARPTRTRRRAGPLPTRLPRRRATIRTPSLSARRPAPPPIPATSRPDPGTRAVTGARAATEARADTGPGRRRSRRRRARLGRARSPAAASARGGRLLVYVVVAALAASIGAGATVALDHQTRPSGGRGLLQRRPRAAQQRVGQRSLVVAAQPGGRCRRRSIPGLVDIISTLKYNGETAEGTGMIISSSGLVLTNNHVIDGPPRAAPRWSPPRARTLHGPGPRLRRHRRRGAAPARRRLRADPGELRQLRAGPPGHPGARARQRRGPRRGHARPGIINALNRSIQASDEGSNTTENLNHMLQTNARIQQGDSGGALANNAGQVIGMITAANTGSSASPARPAARSASPSRSTARCPSPGRSRRASPAPPCTSACPASSAWRSRRATAPNPQQQAADAGAGRPRRPGARRPGRLPDQQPAAGVPAQVAPVAAGALIVGVLCDTAAPGRRAWCRAT